MVKIVTQPAGRPTFPDAGYYGLLGEIVQHAAPQSEGDPCGSLAALISYTSAMFGRSVATRIKMTEHPLGISTLLIGDSGNGKKGSAAGAVMPALMAADPLFMKGCRLGAVASGEGLIAAVADPTPEQRKAGVVLGVPPFEGDVSELPPWQGGRRAIFHDSEFSQGTMVALSNGTTAAVMRKCFDGDDLLNATKKFDLATRPHVVFHGHTTPMSFAQRVNGVHAEGGTYNRFLVFYVHQSKIDADPDVPKTWMKQAERHGRRLGTAIRKMRAGWEEGHTHYITLDAGAKKLWRDGLLEELSISDGDDLEVVKQFTSRAAPICLRLASLYAAVDGRYKSSAADLAAAAIPVRYSKASARRVSMQYLNSQSGETLKERERREDLSREMASRNGTGMGRSAVVNFFNNNVDAAEINRILVRLGAWFTEARAPGARRAAKTYYLPQFAPVNAKPVEAEEAA